MNFAQFCDSQPVALPKSRDTDGPFDQYLQELFDQYLATVDRLDDHDPDCAIIKGEKKRIAEVSMILVAAMKAYLNGFPHEAYTSLRQVISVIHTWLDPLKIVVGDGSEDADAERLYRIRLGKLDKFTRSSMFHIPFELRHLVSTQRYSISGLPSLYLGGSLWVCWEELQRPNFHEIQLCRFKYKEPLTVLDFGFRPSIINLLRTISSGILFSDDQVRAYMICWPLLAACSIRVRHLSQPFIPEYVIPQLLLQWLLNEGDLDGVRYFSTKINQDGHFPSAAMNYVFPVRENAASGYCPVLKRQFCLTSPAAWSILTNADFTTSPMTAPGWPISVTDDQTVMYFKTEFFKCEQKIEGMAYESVL